MSFICQILREYGKYQDALGYEMRKIVILYSLFFTMAYLFKLFYL